MYLGVQTFRVVLKAEKQYSQIIQIALIEFG